MGRHPSRRHVTPEQAPVGPRIRQRRRELDMTQSDLGGSEYTKSFISQLEGGYADPSLDTLRFLGRRLQMGLSSLAGDAADQRLSTMDGLLAWGREAARARDVARARSALNVAREWASGAGAHLHLADALLLMARVEVKAGELERAAAILEEAADIPRTPGPRVPARLALARGWLALRSGDPARADEAFLDALRLVRKASRHQDLAVYALLGLAAAAVASGNLPRALRRLGSAARAAQQYRLDILHGRALAALAHVEQMMGAGEDALQHATEASRLLSAADDVWALIEAERTLGRLLSAQGRASEALEPLRRLPDLWNRAGDRGEELEAVLALGRAALAAGDSALAQSMADRAQAMAGRSPDAAARARSAALVGRALLAAGRRDQAAPLLAGALAEMDAAGEPDEVAEAATDLGEFHRARGEEALAARYLEIASGARRRAIPGEPWPFDPVF
jgi:tetratricopeptide (TPR) repeat protein